MSKRNMIITFEEQFRKTKTTCEKAMAQLNEAQLHEQINPQQNSIAAIVQHVAGNLESRWTNFLTSDGEKPGRDRESEFADRQLPRAELMALWERGWQCAFDALAGLCDDDLVRTVTIRRQPHSVLAAIVRSIEHCGYHSGQITLIGKHLVGDQWNYLTVRPGGSAEFNRKMGV
jgi:hypothetical protein